MPDVSLSLAEQYRLESFLEQVSGQTAADIAHFERIGEAALAEGKRLFQEQIRMMRDLLADKGVTKRAPGVMRPIPPAFAASVIRDAVLGVAPPVDLDQQPNGEPVA